MDRTRQLHRHLAKVWNRRNPVVAARFDEGPLHHPICGPCARILLVLPTGGFFEFKTYALAGRLRASWMDARVTKVARISARFSESLARRRFRQNQEKVRSTTQRRGRTTKPLSRRRFGDQRLQPRPRRIPQIARMTLALSLIKPTLLLRPYRCSPSR